MTNDAKTGVDQTISIFWQRLFVKFTTVMMEEQKRSTQAEVSEHCSWTTLRSRWRGCIQKETMLFASIFQRIRAQEKVVGMTTTIWRKPWLASSRYRAMTKLRHRLLRDKKTSLAEATTYTDSEMNYCMRSFSYAFPRDVTCFPSSPLFWIHDFTGSLFSLS